MARHRPSFENIQYGEYVVYDTSSSGKVELCRVESFNPDGVFLNKTQEFRPYDQIRFNNDSPNYGIHFRGKFLGGISKFFYIIFCKAATLLIRTTQQMNYKH